MAFSFAYIVLEWCTQSHLSTEDYRKASRGLKRTRAFKKWTSWIRDGPNAVITGVMAVRYKLRRGRGRSGRRSLVWTAYTKPYRDIPEAEPLQDWRVSSPEEDRVALEMSPQRTKNSGAPIRVDSMQTLQLPPAAQAMSRSSSNQTQAASDDGIAKAASIV